MATKGSDFSISISAEAQNSVKITAITLLKKYKVKISNAIKIPFPFLEILRDRGFITDKKYKESRENFKKISVREVVYDILSDLEKTFDLPLLDALFSKVIMGIYPDLKGIYKIFKNEMPNITNFLESDVEENEERSDTQLGLEQESVDLIKSPTSGNIRCKSVRSPEAPSGFSAEKCPEAGSSAVKRRGADQEGFMGLGNKSALQKPKRRRAIQQPSVSVNFRAEILPVECGKMKGLLIRRKLERGATRKCIRTEDGSWLTPREFEVRGGYEKASNWKTSLTCGGETLKRLIELKLLHPPPTTREIKKEENSDKCKICQDGGKLFCCENCQSFFHGDCHLPPVKSKRNGWNCTFCTIENSSQSLQSYRESEVLVEQMETWRKSKCEFLLLKLYQHLESNIFSNIPPKKYATKTSQYLRKLRQLDVIKNKLIKENYCKVKDFKEAMDKFFQDPRCEKLHLNQEEFMKNFKKVFAIQETN